MAFKATRKTTPKAKKEESTTSLVSEDVVVAAPQPEPAAPPVQNESFSVEDLVGGPVSQRQVEPVSAPQQTPTSAPMQNEPGNQMQPQEQRAPSYGSPYRSRPQGDRGGYDSRGGNQSSGGGGYQPRGQRYFGGGNDRFRRPPQRRDFTPVENGNGYTQDINVPTQTVHGMLDIMPEGHGFLRPKFTPSDTDVYISQSQIRRFLLRNGDNVEGQARAPKENERYFGLLKVEKINEKTAEEMEKRPKFEDLVPVYPNKQLVLETEQHPLSTRIIDLVAPIGFGQRGLIVSPPKAGKTTIIKELAAGITANYPQIHLMAALIGERPEEVTDITRSVKGEVLASNFDQSPQEQTRIAEVALERAKRLVEMGKDVVILLDSITRLARAYNMVVNPSGRTLSGGFDPAALYPAKRFLGAARCVEPMVLGPLGLPIIPETPPEPKEGQATTGGSLTVIGTALVDTGSRMDDLIYEEFKGTGNMELHLSRILQERRVFPAIDVAKSGTRHDELLLGEDMMKRITTLRHMLSLLSEEERTVMLIDRLSKTKTNAEFLESLGKGA